MNKKGLVTFGILVTIFAVLMFAAMYSIVGFAVSVTTTTVLQPSLSSADITSDSSKIGDLSGATLITIGNTGTSYMHILDVDNVVVLNGPLPLYEYPFYLEANEDQKNALKAYFIAKGWPSDYVNQINSEIEGTSPFFYFVSDGFGNYQLIDGFLKALTSTNQPLRIDDDYPSGEYTYNGMIGSQPKTVKLTVMKQRYVNNVDTTCGGMPLCYSTIQDAIDDASDGDTINVAAGIYEEQLEIDKNLVIQGAGQDVTNILSPTSLSVKFTATYDNRPIVYVHDTQDFTIRDLTINGDGRGNGNYRFDGLAFYNAGGTVENLKIIDIRETPFSGAQHGVAIYAYNSDGNPRQLTITGCTILDFQKNGVALLGNGLDVNVNNNAVTGVGATVSIAQNCIQIGNGATGSITNNVVGNVECDASSCSNDWYNDWQSIAILVMGAGGPFDISGNNASNSDIGIYSELTGSSYSIENNILEDNRYFGIVLGSGDANVNNGSISGSEVGILNPSERTSGTTTVINVKITENILATRNDASALVIDAIHNWWGTADETAIPPMFFGNVDYLPLCLDDTCTTFGNGIPPTLNGVGFTANGTAMTGSVESGFVLNTNNDANTDYALQFTSSSVASENLETETVGLYLQPMDGQTAALQTYYSTKPAPYQAYLNGAAAGTNPFAYIKTGGTTIQLLDGAQYYLSGGLIQKDMIVPDNYPLGNYTVSGNIHDIAGNEATVTYILIVAGDRTAPTLTVTGFTADSNPMSGDMISGYTLDTNNVASHEYLIQFATGTAVDETLKNEYFPLTLVSSSVSPSELKDYYDARGVPEPFLSYLKSSADGTNPFAYINGDTIKIVDAARHDILGGTDTDMAVPGDYPLGIYNVSGQIEDLAGNMRTVTFTLIVSGDREAPIIILNGDIIIDIPYNDTYTEFGATVTDNHDVGLTATIGGDSVITSIVGTYNVTYDSVDAAGNHAIQVIRTVNVVKANQTITFNPIGDKTYGDADFMPISSASSGLPVTITASGNCYAYDSSVLSNGFKTLSAPFADTVHITGAGSCTVDYYQHGNMNYNSASPVSQGFTISKAAATITLSDLGQTYDGTPKAVSYSTEPTGLDAEITYDGSPIAPTESGIYNVVATIDDANYMGSASGKLTITEADSSSVTNSSTNSSVNITFGEETDVSFNLTNTNVNLGIITISNVTDGAITVNELTTAPNTGAVGIPALGKYIEIVTSSDIESAMMGATIKLYYNDAEVAAAGIDESTLRLYYYNTTTGNWITYPTGGVNTTGNYVWAITDHFSLWGVFGNLLPIIPGIGGSGPAASCTASWTCTGWSECVNGVQTRTCGNSVPACDTPPMPATTQTCGATTTTSPTTTTVSEATTTTAPSVTTTTAAGGPTGAVTGGPTGDFIANLGNFLSSGYAITAALTLAFLGIVFLILKRYGFELAFLFGKK